MHSGNDVIVSYDRWAMVVRLAPIYKAEPVFIASLCDEVLDRSGALLGRVREVAWEKT